MAEQDLFLLRTGHGPVVRGGDGWTALPDWEWDALFRLDDVLGTLESIIEDRPLLDPTERPRVITPVQSQEIWAAGVTWLRSRTARMEESVGGSDFYDRVYDADRPELFLKATPHRCVGDGEPMTLRTDASWIVPEPELTLAVSAGGRVFGYTVGNDLSCRDLEAENPLYLPRAKTFDACAAVGPGILVRRDPLPDTTLIRCSVRRDDTVVFSGDIPLSRMKRRPEDLVPWLTRHNRFPAGCFLMTGTGIVPPDDFSLVAGDVVEITIDGIGTLRNPMETT
ncbi:MAG: 2-hydroxyhepta-2,4-diene-1,7-dioate isomerase [Planctomycetes bacterium]|nr:2-hydroxyhepta-2,4-diene-1,7-dioate isomerase [Planctomycetota bacterium]